MVSKRISELPAAGELDGSEQIPLTQDGETRRISGDTYQQLLGQPDTAAANRQALQAFYDNVTGLGAEGHLPDGTVWEIDEPVRVHRDNATTGNDKGWVWLRGIGVVIRKASSFTGDRLFTIDASGGDEDLIGFEGITFDGLDDTVNGLDWYKDTVAFDLASIDHDETSNEYTKAVRLVACQVTRCYRGVRYIGNNLRCPGTLFRNNLCGVFGPSTANDAAFHGAAFRVNDVGVEMYQSTSNGLVSWTFSGCTFESNANCGIHYNGGDLAIIGGHWENNGHDLTRTGYDSGGAVPPDPCGIYRRGSTGPIQVVGGRWTESPTGMYALVLERCSDSFFALPSPPVKIDGAIRRTTFAGGQQASRITLTTNASIESGSYLEVGGVLQKIVSGALEPLHHPGTPAARVERTTNQSIANNTPTTVTWETEQFDTADMWASGSPTILTIPEDGIYLLTVATVWASNSTGQRFAKLLVNGANAAADRRNAIENTQASVSELRSLVSGDEISVEVSQTSGGALNLVGNRQLFLSAQKVSEV